MLRMISAVTVTLALGCSGVSHQQSPELAAALDQRQVEVILQPNSTGSFLPIIQNRLISAEPMYVVEREYARVKYIEGGINMVRLVESCEAVPLESQTSCSNAIRVENVFGPAESSAVTDSDGRALINLQNKSYRLLLQTVPTTEDSTCYWSGAITIDEQMSVVEVPMLVHCESG